MKYNFDNHINRLGTDSLKWDFVVRQTGRTDIKPLWVADMDFATPPFVINAIEKRLKNQILGYTLPFDAYYQSIISWLGRRYDISLAPDDLHFIPGVVPGLHHTICSLTEKGDKILIQTPVYHPFHHVIEINERQKVESPLKIVDGRFEMDFDDLEKKLPGCKMMFLCNPHNPGGTVWKPEELKQLALLCKDNGVLVVSDEIHADMTHPGHTHIPFCKICSEADENSLTLMAPSKTFNMPGIVTSYCFTHNVTLRRKFYHFLEMSDVTCGNSFAYDCLMACYTDEGEEWLNQMLDYVTANIRATEDFLSLHCPKIKPMKTEASFLMFLDNRQMPFEDTERLNRFYIDQAGVYLNEGLMFGRDGNMFMRLNAALPRNELIASLQQIKQAYNNL